MKKTILLCLSTIFALCVFAQASYTNGIFIVNEDWFGHNSSSVNFYSYDDGSVVYRAYQAANPGMTLGNTTQYAELNKDNIYFCSKQNYGETGGRLIVADAKTLAKKHSLDNIDDADTRAFVTVNGEKGYIGTNSGIFVFNTATFELGAKIDGTAKEEIGNMVLCGDKVLATVRGVGYHVIDVRTNVLEKTIDLGKITTIFVVNGQPYAAVNDATWGTPAASNTEQFIKIDPATFELTAVSTVPMASQNTWFAWKNASPAVDQANEVLYYCPAEGANFICKYDIKSAQFTQQFITFDEGQKMYGNVVGFDPVNNYIAAMTFKNYGDQDYWLTLYNTSGEKVNQVKLNANYWFPAMFLFASKTVPTSVDNVESSKVVAGVQYFNLQGQQSAEPFKGVNIVKTIYTDGTSTTAKVLR